MMLAATRAPLAGRRPRACHRKSEARDLFALLRDRRVARDGDVVCSVAFQGLLGALLGFSIFGVNRDQDIAVLDFSFVALGFEFAPTETDQAAGDAANRSACGSAAERRHP